MNAHGVARQPADAGDGMVAPVVSQERFEWVLRGRRPLHVGPEQGSW
ncbi:MAG TPA: hypothetical protein VHS99_25835 [Chloroflexota bacterium]|nr:hypothetical protein [Chloroflexota bacterium]